MSRKAGDYSYRVRWSEADKEFVGTCAEFPSLSWLSADQDDARDGIEKVVGEVLQDMLHHHETPPLPSRPRKAARLVAAHS